MSQDTTQVIGENLCWLAPLSPIYMETGDHAQTKGDCYPYIGVCFLLLEESPTRGIAPRTNTMASAMEAWRSPRRIPFRGNQALGRSNLRFLRHILEHAYRP